MRRLFFPNESQLHSTAWDLRNHLNIQIQRPDQFPPTCAILVFYHYHHHSWQQWPSWYKRNQRRIRTGEWSNSLIIWSVSSFCTVVPILDYHTIVVFCRYHIRNMEAFWLWVYRIHSSLSRADSLRSPTNWFESGFWIGKLRNSDPSHSVLCWQNVVDP